MDSKPPVRPTARRRVSEPSHFITRKPRRAKPPKSTTTTTTTPTPLPPALAQAGADAGWSSYALHITRSTLRNNLMRIRGKKPTDLTDPAQFPRPVRLHRQVPDHLGRKKLSQIPPPPSRKPTTSRVYRPDRGRREDRYPLRLEDASGKNAFSGQLEAGLGDGRYGVLVRDGRGGGFRLELLDGWYSFKPVGRFAALTTEEAEAKLDGGGPMPSWLAQKVVREKAREVEQARGQDAMRRGLSVKRGKTVRAQSDMNATDYLDYEEGPDDDEEGSGSTLFESPEEEELERLTKERIRREQLSANLFGTRSRVEEEEGEKQTEFEEKLETLRKSHGAAVRKSLMEKEKNFLYGSDSDSDHDPYAPSDEEPEEQSGNTKEPRSPAKSRSSLANTEPVEAPPDKPTKFIKHTRRERKLRAKANQSAEPAPKEQKTGNPVPVRAARRTNLKEPVKNPKPQKRSKPETAHPEEPAPKRQKTAAPTPTGPITDAEVKAVLSSNPAGVTIGSILSTFRPRISVDGKRDELAWGTLVATLKRLSRGAGTGKGVQKRYKLKEEE